MKLRYTIRAAAELDEILSYIDDRFPQGGLHVKKRIHAIIGLLLQHPDAGRPTVRGMRRVVAYPYPCLIFYRAGSRRSSSTVSATAPASRSTVSSVVGRIAEGVIRRPRSNGGWRCAYPPCSIGPCLSRPSAI